MEKIIYYIEGKKTYTLAIVGLVVPFCVAKGYLDSETGALISGIFSILLGGAKYAGAKYGKRV